MMENSLEPIDYVACAEQLASQAPELLDAVKRMPLSERFEAAKIQERHREIIRLIILGYRNIEIAQALGCTPQTVCNVRNSKLAQAKLAELHGIRDESMCSISERIAAVTAEALDTKLEIMRNPLTSERLKDDIASDLLDRGGYKPTQRVEGAFMTAVLSADDIIEIRRRARENGAVVDIKGNAASEPVECPSPL